MLKEHVWLKLTMLVMISLLIFSISDFPSVIPSGSQLGTTVQAKGKGHLPNLLDQQIAILVGLDINPNWVKEQSAADSLIYGIVKPDDTVPAGINEDYSYLVTSNRDKEISLFFKADKKKVTIKYANRGKSCIPKPSRCLGWLSNRTDQETAPAGEQIRRCTADGVVDRAA